MVYTDTRSAVLRVEGFCSAHGIPGTLSSRASFGMVDMPCEKGGLCAASSESRPFHLPLADSWPPLFLAI